MEKQMGTMLDELKKVENVEQMVELENEIAGTLGNGFLKGELDYQYLLRVKEEVEHIEAGRKEQFEKNVPEQTKRMAHTR